MRSRLAFCRCRLCRLNISELFGADAGDCDCLCIESEVSCNLSLFVDAGSFMAGLLRCSPVDDDCLPEDMYKSRMWMERSFIEAQIGRANKTWLIVEQLVTPYILL